jgi:hypothetical protein
MRHGRVGLQEQVGPSEERTVTDSLGDIDQASDPSWARGYEWGYSSSSQPVARRRNL